ncbi:MAG: hypothetical protein IPK60_09185 [Sandaracinaceae bacterium]|nr:hypothetical protein [Sandaracinaceae bacterium]
MISKLVSALIALVGLISFGYVFFVVPIGRRTLYEHVKNIAATPEAHELGTDVREATTRVTDRVTQEWEAAHSDGGLPNMPVPSVPTLPVLPHATP